MADELKNWFNQDFYTGFVRQLHAAHPAFDDQAFIRKALSGIDSLSLMARLRRTTELMHQVLPSDYGAALDILYPLAAAYKGQFVGMVFPDFVSRYGLDDFDKSMAALNHFTRYSSSEFAIRPFLKTRFEPTLEVMKGWARDENEHVRRLASEGCRPRLPWSFNLPLLIANPDPARDILDRLNADPSLYVRKSVANHLNDISKDHPETMLDWVNAWDLSNKQSAWIAKYAARSLLKQGHPRAFSLFGFEARPEISIKNMQLDKPRLELGERIVFSFDLISLKQTPQKLAVDYIVHYVKKSGQRSPKVFKLKELTLLPGDVQHISKSQQFKNFTTRIHYAGRHQIELVINGQSMAMLEFDLIL